MALLILIGLSFCDRPSVANKGYLFPLADPIVTNGKYLCSDWCSRLRKEENRVRKYMALNYPTPYGAPIYSPGDGIVVLTKISGYEGASIFIRLDDPVDDIEVEICHLSRYEVLEKTTVEKKGRRYKVPTRVKRGEVIGYAGTSGRTTGCHVRIVFRVNGEVAFACSTTWGMPYNAFIYSPREFDPKNAQMYKPQKMKEG